MARDTVAVTTLVAMTRTRSPLHVGGLGAAAGQDAPVARDARGRPIVPGTSITGALRGVLDHAVDQLDEPGPTWGDAANGGPGASRVVVHDAILSPTREIGAPADERLGRRDGVAIDRALGSAVDGLLYGREVVPAGWWARITIELHSAPDAEESDLALLATIRSALVRGVSFGARTSRGLGELSADPSDISVTQVRYDSPEGFWSTRRKPATPTLPAADPRASDILDITIDWKPDGPVVVGTGATTASLSFLPVMEQAPDGRIRMVLPGTSTAGAFRARAELVCRTLANRATPSSFADQLGDSPLVSAVFGAPAGTEGATWSSLHVSDCASITTVHAETWFRAVTPKTPGQQPGRTVQGAKGAELRRTEHVAIDRWTGGASDGRLFSEYEPHGFTFEPLRFRLHLGRLPGHQRAVAIMLLLITVRELAEGRLPLGGRTTRGYGCVSVTGIRVTGGGLDITAGTTLDLHADEFAHLRTAWHKHLKEA